MKPLATMPVLSRRAGAVLGLALVALVNAVTLGLVAYNRSGEPEAVLALSERELRQPWRSSVRGDENSGLDLALRWRVAPVRVAEGPGDGERSSEDDDGGSDWSYGRQAAWLDAAKLAALGFPPTEEQEGRRGRSRPVLLVLEFDGPAYQAALGHLRGRLARENALRDANPGKKEFGDRARRAAEAVLTQERESSRLFVVDAGLDASALRAAYPDRTRYAIVGGRVRPGRPEAKKPRERAGWVDSVDVAAIHVPQALRSRVPDIESDKAARGGFVARVAFGRRLEPWIAAIETTAPRR